MARKLLAGALVALVGMSAAKASHQEFPSSSVVFTYTANNLLNDGFECTYGARPRCTLLAEHFHDFNGVEVGSIIAYFVPDLGRKAQQYRLLTKDQSHSAEDAVEELSERFGKPKSFEDSEGQKHYLWPRFNGTSVGLSVKEGKQLYFFDKEYIGSVNLYGEAFTSHFLREYRLLAE